MSKVTLHNKTHSQGLLKYSLLHQLQTLWLTGVNSLKGMWKRTVNTICAVKVYYPLRKIISLHFQSVVMMVMTFIKPLVLTPVISLSYLYQFVNIEWIVWSKYYLTLFKVYVIFLSNVFKVQIFWITSKRW